MWILGVALAPRILILIMALPNQERMIVHDAEDYIYPAENWLAGNGFSQSQEAPYVPETRRTPAYSALIVAGMTLTGDSWPIFMALFQVILSVLMVLLIYLIARMLTDEKRAFWAAIFLGLSLGHVCYTAILMSDVLYAFFVLVATYLLLRNRQKSSWIDVGLLGVVLGLATLTRPVGMFVPFLLAPFLIWGSKGGSWKKGLGQSVLVVLLSFLVISPWMIRQGEVLGYKAISTVPMRNLLLYNAAMLRADREGRTLDELYLQLQEEVFADLEAIGESDNLGLRYKTFQERGKEIIKDDFAHYLPLHLKRSLVSFLPNVNDLLEMVGVTDGSRGTLAVLHDDGIIPAIKFYFHGELWALPILLPFLIILGMVYLFSAFGLWSLAKNDMWVFLLFGVMIGYFMFVSGPVAVPRFRLPVQPHFCALAGIGMGMVLEWRKNRKTGIRPQV